MLHLVPLAGARRKVADGNLQTRLVRQTLQLQFPETQAVSIASAAVGGDEQAAGPRIQSPAFLTPPPSDGGHRKGGRVMVCSHGDKAGVPPQIVDAVWIGPRHGWAGKIVAGDPFGALLLAPLAAFVLVVSDQFLFFGVHGNHGPSLLQRQAHLLVDMPELGVAIRMILPLLGLAVAL